MKRGNVISSVFFLVLFAGVAILSFLVVRPFLAALLAGALLAYISYPLYSWLQRKISSKSMAALLVSVLVIFIVSIPSILVLTHLTKQAQSVYLQTKEHFANNDFVECYEDNLVCNLITQVRGVLESDAAEVYVTDLSGRAIRFLTQKVASIVLDLPQLLLMIFLAIFTMYYLLKDGKNLFYRITDASPLSANHRCLLVKQFSDMTSAIIFGSIVIALIQGAVATLGFWIAGIDGFLMWGLITVLTSLIPFVGAWLVWFPASAYLAGAGYMTGDTGMLWRALFLFLYGVFVISLVDNVLKPFLVAGKARVHPLLVFFGVVGGLLTFGVIGLFIGPVLLGLFQTLFVIYEKEMKR